MEKVYTEHLDPHAVVMVIATTFERLTLQALHRPYLKDKRERSVCPFCGLG